MATWIRTWFLRSRILAVRQLRQGSFYLLSALVLALYLFLSSLSLPAAANRSVGLYVGGGQIAEEVSSLLLEEKGAYTFHIYENEAQLRNAVQTGEADCGFTLDERLDQAVEASLKAAETPGEIAVPELKNTIDYYYSSSTSKGPAVKEMVYAALLQAVNPVIVQNAVRSGLLLSDGGTEAQENVLKEYAAVLEEDGLLHVNFEVYGESKETQDTDGDIAGNKGTAAMVAGALLFLSALLLGSVRFRKEADALRLWFRGDAFLYRVLEVLVPLFLISILLLAVMLLQGLLKLPLCLLLLVILIPTSVWIVLFAGIVRKEAVYLFLSAALVLLFVILSSPAGSLSFLRSINWMRYLLPGYWMNRMLLL